MNTISLRDILLKELKGKRIKVTIHNETYWEEKQCIILKNGIRSKTYTHHEVYTLTQDSKKVKGIFEKYGRVKTYKMAVATHAKYEIGVVENLFIPESGRISLSLMFDDNRVESYKMDINEKLQEIEPGVYMIEQNFFSQLEYFSNTKFLCI